MTRIYASLWAETLKVRRSKIFIITIITFSSIAILMGLMIYVSRSPELVGKSAIVSAKSSMFKDEWSSYFGLLTMIILTLGTIGFGTITGWVFGREYSDRTMKDLLALPVHRSSIVLSKFIIIFLWSFLLSLILFISGLLTGFLVNIAHWSYAAAYHSFGVFMITSVLTALLCTPVAFVASFARGYIAPIGFTIGTLIITQIIFVGIPNITAYFPWAIPALYSGVSGAGAPTPDIFSYFILSLTILLGLLGTALWWHFADQS
ncbi:ABC transporter permease [Methanobacterium alcaliphilum]|uniref:ABC transporter permease n=1 Tax=Methanobacterium alcaliphilum TaxID=392018 RepID=UPI00200A64AA|nr:ABC transporter permease [Methanobacterium alcaliphilum]MCK9151387.1 ABC transporter permease [Methanobacterium alcaliphilum]